jgi:hypothetical protein
MAITYENVIFDRVIDSIQTILADEFSIPVLFDDTAERGNQSFLVLPNTDDQVDTLSSGQIRQATVLINYELKTGGNYTKNSVKQITEITERLKRLLFNNKTYYVSGTNRFRNGIVENITYEREDEINRSITTFTCQTMELV